MALPLFPDFRSKILPVLAVYWAAALVFSLVYSSGLPLAIAGVLSPMTIMLWPVGRRFGLKYTEYRTPWFIASTISMVGVLLTAGLIIDTVAGPPIKYIALVTLVVVVIGLFGLLTAHRRAFGKPMKLFFRPDLILGNNRVLAGGLAALAIGMKFMFSNAPPGDIPVGNWYALLFLIVLGLYQIIPLRGLIKMRTMVSRMAYDKKGSYGITVLKELYLVVAISLLLFSAHNFFGGVTPFTNNVLAGSSFGVSIMVVSGAILVLLRAWYKKHIGDPFFKETFAQSVVKDTILVVLITVFFYGFINVMVGKATLNNGQFSYLTLMGLGLYAFGAILLIPVRAWIRQNLQYGSMRQMIHMVLPSLNEESRAKALGKIIKTVADLPENRRLELVKNMVGFLNEMPQKDRDKVMKTQLQIISSLAPNERLKIMKAMDSAMMG